MARIINFEGRQIQVPDDATDAEVQGILSGGPASAQVGPMGMPMPADAQSALIGPPPDQTTPEQQAGYDDLSKTLQDAFPQPKTTVGGVARAIGGGFNRGIATGAASLIDAVNFSPMLLNLLPGDQGFGPLFDPKIAGSGVARRRVREMGLDMSKSDTPTERIVGGGAEFAGSMVPYLAQPYMAAAGRGFGTVAPVAQSLPGRAGRAVAEGLTGVPTEASILSAQNAPVRHLADQMVTGAAAGVGGQAMKEVNDSLPSQLMGNLLGAFGAGLPMGYGRRIGQMLGNLAGAPGVIREQGMQGAGQILAGNRESSTQDVIRAIEENTPRVAEIPGAKGTLGQVSNDPGIKALEYSRQTGGPSPGKFRQREEDNRGAIQDLLNANAPEPGAAERLIEQMGLEQGNRLSGAQDQLHAANRAAQEAAPRATMEATTRGAMMRPQIAGAQQAARGVEREAWAPIDAADFPVPAAPLAERFQAALDAIPEAKRAQLPADVYRPQRWAQTAEDEGADAIGGLDTAGMSPEEAEMARALTGGAAPEAAPAEVNIREINGLRSVLTDAASAAASAGEPDKQRMLIGLVEELDGAVDEVVPPDYVDMLQEARAASRDYNDRFTRTFLGDTLGRDQTGAFRMPQSDIAANVIQPNEGNLEPLRQLMPEVGERAPVATALRDQIMAEASRATTPEQMRQFIQQYGAVLQAFPEAGQALQRAAQTGSAAQAAEGTMRDTARAVGPQSTVGRFVSQGQRDPVAAMRRVMAQGNAAPAQIDELLRFAGDTPQALEGMRRAAWDGIVEKATSKMVDPDLPIILRTAKFRDLLNQNAPSLDRLYRGDRTALDNLGKLADVAEMLQRVNRARPTGSSGTALGSNNQFKFSMPQIWSRVYAVKRGQVSPHYIVTEMLSRLARSVSAGRVNTATNTILDDALLDPELGKILLTKYEPTTYAASIRRLRTYRKGYYANLLQGVSEDDGDNPDTPPEDLTSEMQKALGLAP